METTTNISARSLSFPEKNVFWVNAISKTLKNGSADHFEQAVAGRTQEAVCDYLGRSLSDKNDYFIGAIALEKLRLAKKYFDQPQSSIKEVPGSKLGLLFRRPSKWLIAYFEPNAGGCELEVVLARTGEEVVRYVEGQGRTAICLLDEESYDAIIGRLEAVRDRKGPEANNYALNGWDEIEESIQIAATEFPKENSEEERAYDEMVLKLMLAEAA